MTGYRLGVDARRRRRQAKRARSRRRRERAGKTLSLFFVGDCLPVLLERAERGGVHVPHAEHASFPDGDEEAVACWVVSRQKSHPARRARVRADEALGVFLCEIFFRVGDVSGFRRRRRSSEAL